MFSSIFNIASPWINRFVLLTHLSQVGLLIKSRLTYWNLFTHIYYVVSLTMKMNVNTIWYWPTTPLLTCFIFLWKSRVSAEFLLLFLATSWLYAWLVWEVLYSSLEDRIFLMDLISSARESNSWDPKWSRSSRIYHCGLSLMTGIWLYPQMMFFVASYHASCVMNVFSIMIMVDPGLSPFRTR